MPIISKKANVSGRVQGVFYRASTKRKAIELQLKGYAKNLADGSVEVLVIGEPGNVESLMSWLWKGSKASKVSNVVVTDNFDIQLSEKKSSEKKRSEKKRSEKKSTEGKAAESESFGADKQQYTDFTTC